MKVKPEWVVRFKAEATAHLKLSQSLIEKLKQKRTGKKSKLADQLIRQLFIKAHSIKGTASMLGQNHIAEQAAELEALWNEALNDPNQRNVDFYSRAATLVGELANLVGTIETIEDHAKTDGKIDKIVE
jgi:chemotaxis protein histidine kinase CheA